MYALLNLFGAWGALRNLLFLFCVARAILVPLPFDETTMIESINVIS